MKEFLLVSNLILGVLNCALYLVTGKQASLLLGVANFAAAFLIHH